MNQMRTCQNQSHELGMIKRKVVDGGWWMVDDGAEQRKIVSLVCLGLGGI